MKPLRVKRDAPIVALLVCLAIQAWLQLAWLVQLALVCLKKACRREAAVLSAVNAAVYKVYWSEETTVLRDLVGCVFSAFGSFVMLRCCVRSQLASGNSPRVGQLERPDPS